MVMGAALSDSCIPAKIIFCRTILFAARTMEFTGISSPPSTSPPEAKRRTRRYAVGSMQMAVRERVVNGPV